MLLIKPEPYVTDPGRTLPEEERDQVAEQITPIEKVKHRSCQRMTTNDGYRAKRRY